MTREQFATLDQHEEAWAKIHDLLAAGHWERAREIFDQATSAERDLTEVTEVCDTEIRRRMELEREIAESETCAQARLEAIVEEQQKRHKVEDQLRAARETLASSAIPSAFREVGTLHRTRNGEVHFIQKDEVLDFPLHSSKTIYLKDGE